MIKNLQEQLQPFERADLLTDTTALYLGKLVGATFGAQSERVKADTTDVISAMQAGQLADTSALFKLNDIATERVIFGRK